MGECEVLWRGGTGGPVAPGGGGGSQSRAGGCLRGPSGEGVCGGCGLKGDGGKKVWLGSERRPGGGGCRCSGELENTSGVRTGSRGGSVGGLSGGSVSE